MRASTASAKRTARGGLRRRRRSRPSATTACCVRARTRASPTSRSRAARVRAVLPVEVVERVARLAIGPDRVNPEPHGTAALTLQAFDAHDRPVATDGVTRWSARDATIDRDGRIVAGDRDAIRHRLGRRDERDRHRSRRAACAAGRPDRPEHRVRLHRGRTRRVRGAAGSARHAARARMRDRRRRERRRGACHALGPLRRSRHDHAVAHRRLHRNAPRFGERPIVARAAARSAQRVRGRHAREPAGHGGGNDRRARLRRNRSGRSARAHERPRDAAAQTRRCPAANTHGGGTAAISSAG